MLARYLRTLRLQRMLSQFSAKRDIGPPRSKWLPTHLWHAKRFHMVDKYGWKLPYTPTQKCTRHSYHSIAKNCAAIDTSYLSVFQLSSDSPTQLIRSLSSIVAPSLDLSQALNSPSPITTTLFHPERYPYGALGPATLLPVSDSHVWLLMHPAMLGEFEELIGNLSEVQCSDLTAEIGAIQLVGPASLSTVLKALPPDIDSSSDSDVSSQWYEGFNHRCTDLPNLLEKMIQIPQPQLPVDSLLGYTALDPRLSLPRGKVPSPFEDPEPDELMSLLIELQNKLQGTGESSQSPSQAENIPTASGAEATLDTMDTVDPLCDITSLFCSHRKLLAVSQLFSKESRHESVVDKHTDDVINSHRFKCFHEDTISTLPFPRDRVPLLLLSVSGAHAPIGSTGQYGAGVMLLLPREWVLTSLVAITYWGAKPVGKKELDRVSFERQAASFPTDFTDTSSYVQHALDRKKGLERRYLSYPPDKRLEYGKLGVDTPFHCPWASLVGHEPEERELDSIVSPRLGLKLPYFLLRDRRAILSLQQLLFKKHMPYRYIPRVYKLRYPCKRLPPLPDPLPLHQIIEQYPSALLLVSVHMLLRGCVRERDKLFLPTEEDLQTVVSTYHKSCEDRDLLSLCAGKTNPLGRTVVTADRQIVTGVSVLSERVIKTARKRLKRCKKKLNQIRKDPPNQAPLICCLYKPTDSCLESLQLAPHPPDPRECCGYVTSGEYSFCRGYSAGVACVSLTSLHHLIETQGNCRLPPIVLLRNPSSPKLAPAVLALIHPT